MTIRFNKKILSKNKQQLTISKTRLLPLLGGKGLYGLEIEVVVKMQVVEVLTMDEQVEHVVTLSTHLQSRLHPVQRRRLEELGCLERSEQISKKKKKRSILVKTFSYKGLKLCIKFYFDKFTNSDERTVVIKDCSFTH